VARGLRVVSTGVSTVRIKPEGPPGGQYVLGCVHVRVLGRSRAVGALENRYAAHGISGPHAGLPVFVALWTAQGRGSGGIRRDLPGLRRVGVPCAVGPQSGPQWGGRTSLRQHAPARTVNALTSTFFAQLAQLDGINAQVFSFASS